MVHTEGVRDTVLSALALLERERRRYREGAHLPCESGTVVEGRGQPGATIGLDCFGSIFAIDSETAMNPNDQARIEDLREIFDAGHGDKVFVSNDICMKMRLHKYGGWGYDHIQTNLYPFLRARRFHRG